MDGLWLQGCDFDGVKLNEIRDTSGNSSELINLPPCNIAWIKRDDPEPYGQGTVVSITIYLMIINRMSLSITHSTEKSSFAHSMCQTTAKTGRESLEVSLCSSTGQTHDKHEKTFDLQMKPNLKS